ncbi:hypothetical protein ScPMuIL_008605 [Solemya velum]
MSGGPDFVKDSSSYNVKEFYEMYHGTLPQFVMVVQGYMGEILLETFGTNQVLRIHTVSKQPRIIAKVIGDSGKYRNKLLSIPQDFPSKMCVVKSPKKVGKEQTLKDIIESNKLPVDVKFGSGEITIGAQVKVASQLSTLQLIERFEEMYLLGNCVNAGALDARQVAMPLYLPDLQLALITGIKGKSEQAWQTYNAIMEEQVDAVCTFNTNYGNQDIAVYTTESVNRDTMIAYVEPSVYANLHDIFPQIKQEDVYSNVDNVPGLYKKTEPILPNGGNKVPFSKVPIKSDGIYSNSHITAATPDVTECEVKPRPQVAPKPQRPKEPDVMLNDSAPPPIPTRSPQTHVSLQTEKENVYTNNVPRAKVSPVLGPKHTKMMSNLVENEERVIPPVDISLSANSSNRSSQNSDQLDIESLAVEDVSHWLHELKLDKYVEIFEENCIDGAILTELNVELLKSEFSFNPIEAIRLMKFVTGGHIPKHTQK